jgi:hypothetical protein
MRSVRDMRRTLLTGFEMPSYQRSHARAAAAEASDPYRSLLDPVT